MKCIVVVMFLCFTFSKSLSSEKTDSLSQIKANTTSEQSRWVIKLNMTFSKTLPSLIQKPLGSDLKIKCEAIMNFVKVEKLTKGKEGTEISLAELPPEHKQRLMKNVIAYWMKDNIPLQENDRLVMKMDKTNDTIATFLRLKKINFSDQGDYTCAIKQSYEKKQTTKLVVVKEKSGVGNFEIPSTASGFREKKIYTNTSSTSVLSEGITLTNASMKNITTPQKLEPICQEYVGKICEFLKGQYVYIPYDTSQSILEQKLFSAIQVTMFSNDISSNCEGYALPSLCYSTFPICRNPQETNDFFFKEAKLVFSILSGSAKDIDSQTDIDSLPPHVVYKINSNATIERLNYRNNSTVLRRVCKQDCEILENELCQTEYAIAKRHPHIGQQLTLEECQDLPDDDPDCLKVGVGTLMVSDDECYWENGNAYLGRVNISDTGLSCIEWSKQLQIRINQYPELAGRHSYCRNPGGMNTQPWCFVDIDGKSEKQLCNIPKCAHKIWIYIVVIFLLLTLSVIGFIICLCYRQKNKANAATIRDINLPNADKNIYGNSRLNSPIEMNDMTNQNLNNQPHLTSNTRGNGILRVPQYSLAQIKFLEELGEGAFGKVYKGAIKKNGDTIYVAVKALKENATAKTKADFKREIDLISELSHENIVCIVGVALREEPLCMLFEFMARGDLHEFLMGRAPPSGKGLPPMRLLNIAFNIASGMHYLASHHYVHRDLAARNCLVSDDFVVKISDFGLSRDIYSSDYYRVQSKSLLPVRWMPPESILYGKFTTESDIWSYGVVLWEIYSYGLQPYYGYSNQEVISMVRGGEVLAAPAGCPSPMYQLMNNCWKHAPQRRPNFDEIVQRIQDWIQMGGCPDIAMGDTSSNCGHRTISSSRDFQEKVPLLPAHCSSSNGSLTTGSLKKFSIASSSRDDTRSTCSEVPPLAPKKKHSQASLIDQEPTSTRDLVVRIQNNQFGNEI